MSLTTKDSLKTKIDQFREAITAGVDGIIRASEIYVAALDEDAANFLRFREAFDDILPKAAWAQFEAVGRKWIHPKLILGGMADRKKANKIKHLTYNSQERVFNRERFSLLVGDGDSIRVDMMEATNEQVNQLCDGKSIRNLSEQRAWLEAKALREENDKPETLPYVIDKGKVIFKRGVTLTRAEIKRLLQEM